MNIEYLVTKAMRMGASDIHLVTGLSPCVRVDGEIETLGEDSLGPEQVAEMMLPLLTDSQKAAFAKKSSLCFSVIFDESAHVRISLYSRLGRMEAAIRLRPFEIKTLEELGLPAAAAELTRLPSGLVVISGPTGVGKTTTLYSMIDLINRERRRKIVTVEDPIEYLHTHKRSMVVQLEIGRDAPTHHDAILHILRLDPDIICIGEMRDEETVSAALLAAETGHLVIGTLHTPSAAQTVDRILAAFPESARKAVCLRLAGCLRGALTQMLLPMVGRPGRVLAYEILLDSPAVRNHVREGNLAGLQLAIHSAGVAGMTSMDACLRELYESAKISYDTAMTYARDAAIVSGRRTPVHEPAPR